MLQLSVQAWAARPEHSGWVTGRCGQSSESDRWADWLTRGRQRGLKDRQVRAMRAELARVRNRVLAGARLRQEMSILDVGAGSGLLALEARRRVGESGTVIALDVSLDALCECRRTTRPESMPAQLTYVVGDAVALPLPDGCVDALIARSVFIYVMDKSSATRELYRVVRPGGRVSICEPINSQYQMLAEVDLSDLEPARRRVLDHWHAGSDPGDAMAGFDERDLVQHFVEAGFESVELTYKRVHQRSRAKPEQVSAFLTTRPNPNMVSYEEAAREVLGAGADQHLAALATSLGSQPSTSVSATAFVRCRRARR
jgi:arsenite methyltransferase